MTNRRYFRQFYALILISMLAVFAILLASGCGSTQPGSSTATPTLTLTATFPPTPTATPEPLGSASNPYVIGLISEQEDPQVAAAADELAKQVGNLAGVHATGKVFMTYNQLLESLAAGKVHATWMPPLTYLYASQRGLAEVALLTNHFGVYQYGVQFLANVESQLTPYFDPISGLSSADAATALEQLSGLRPCWVEPTSPSGYILPAGLLEENQIPVLPGVLTQSHTAVVRALYIKGICDFGATFAISGDPRTASMVIQDLPDVMNRVLVIWRSDAVIPSLNLSLLAGLSEGDRQVLTNAFLELSKTPEGKALLQVSAENYEIEEMKTVNDTIYTPLRDAAQALKFNLKDGIGK